MQHGAVPQASVYQQATTTPTTAQASINASAQTTSAKPWATIDESSLTTTSAEPTITGTFSGNSLLDITIYAVPGRQTLPPQYEGPGTINSVAGGSQQAYVNNQVTFPGSTLANGRYSIQLSSLQPGTYSVGIYSDSYLLASGVLTVSAPQAVSVPGMSEYTDASFGFSFWYPSSDTVVPTQYTSVQDGSYLYGTETVIVRHIKAPEFSIDEVVSPTMSVLSSVDPGPFGSDVDKYFFDANTHTWMYTSDGGPKGAAGGTTPADVSNNTMGGLHIFIGYTRFGNKVIIPLSATHFLALSSSCNAATDYDCGSASDPTSGYNRFMDSVKTIVATDPSVATPVSAAEQQATIQAEQQAYASTNTSTLSVSPSSGNAPLSVKFAGSFVGVGHTITFGDGQQISENDACFSSCTDTVVSINDSHVYTAAGTYTATAKDTKGNLIGTATIVVQ